MAHYYSGIHVNTTALHLVIMEGSVPLIDAIMSKLSEDTKKKLLNATDKLRIFEAASTYRLPSADTGSGQKHVIEALLGNGATFGNQDNLYKRNVLHSLAMFSKYDPEVCKNLYWFIEEKSLLSDARSINKEMVQLLEMTEIHGLTLLQLACRVGAAEIISCILDTEGYGLESSNIAPLSTPRDYHLKYLDPSFCEEPPSLLEYIAYNETLANISLMGKKPIRSLIEKKWDSYAFLFSMWFVFHVALIAVCTFTYFSPSYSSRNNTSQTSDSGENDDTKTSNDINTFHRILDFGVLVIFSLFIISELGDIYYVFYYIIREGLKGKCKSNPGKWRWFKAIFHDDMSRSVLFIFVFFGILGSRPIEHVQGLSWPRDSFTAISLIFGYLFFIFFVGAPKPIVTLIVIFRKILINDLLSFLVIFAIVLVGCSLGMMLFFPDVVRGLLAQEITYEALSIRRLFYFVMGFGETDYFEDSSNPEMLHTIFMLFLLNANSLMLNMLIAVMADTYQSARDHKHELWLLIKTKYVLLMERRLFRKCHMTYIDKQELLERGKAIPVIPAENETKDTRL